MKRGCAVAAVLALLCAGSASAAERPRLAVKEVFKPPASMAIGESFEVGGRISNSGTRAGRALITLSLRSSVPGDPSVALGFDRLRVKPDRRRRFTTQVTAFDAAPRSYFVVACVKRRGVTGKTACRASRGLVTFRGPASAPGEPFTPGARTLGDPLLPQLGNGGYDAQHYAISLDYDREANTFESATTTMTAVATQRLSEFSLDFQDLPVSAVTVDGAPAQFAQVEATPDLSPSPGVTQPMKLVVTPPTGITTFSTFKVAVTYSGQPRVITDPDHSIEGWIPACYTADPDPQVCDSVFVVGEPMGSQGWFPSNNHPSDKATFETEITVADGEQAFGVGELAGPPVDNPDGTTTWRWVEDDPTATYLTTASNGVFDYDETTVHETGTGRTLPVYNAVDPSATAAQLTGIETLFSRNGEMIDFLGALYGPYPFDSYGAIYDRAPNVGYALEVQTKPHFSSLGTGASTYLHELAHQWFGNAVTLQQWDDIWFNEGWARFSEWTFNFATGASPTSPPEQFATRYEDPAFDWSIAPAVLGGDPANLFKTTPTYTRGAMVLEGYRQIVGDVRFYALAKTIQGALAYSNISTEVFVFLALVFSEFTGERLALLEQYFDQWLFGTTKPTVVPDSFD